ncbi:MAG: FAD-dependent oxidoreductase [Burkholderiales bacterium]|nr:FAD-dependent oxidoreductase [Burkholderiales bacterium]
MAEGLRVAVVGGGWAGLAAAVEATVRGHQVTLFEMAPQLGGRARSLAGDTPSGPADLRLDNGQHILIGAYSATLALMRRVGVDPDQVLLRRPLELLDANGQGLRLRAGSALITFAVGVWTMSHWSLRERWALNHAALGWLLKRFRCDPALTVAELCAALPARVRDDFIDPLCVAALNTPADAASAQVFLRVLHDALFSGPGASDLLIPRRPLADLLPEPAHRWLTTHGAHVHTGRRVHTIDAAGAHWLVDGETFDRVVLACSPAEAARLTRRLAPAWSACAEALGYEPIVTVYLRAPGARLVAPMIALAPGPDKPAQFAFDHGALGINAGVFAFVVSGAAPWVSRGMAATTEAVLRQARDALRGAAPASIEVLKTVAEKRATLRCVPKLQRPPATIAPGFKAAGDHIAGPYPSTLEGAVRSGLAAVDLLGI